MKKLWRFDLLYFLRKMFRLPRQNFKGKWIAYMAGKPPHSLYSAVGLNFVLFGPIFVSTMYLMRPIFAWTMYGARLSLNRTWCSRLVWTIYLRGLDLPKLCTLWDHLCLNQVSYGPVFDSIMYLRSLSLLQPCIWWTRFCLTFIGSEYEFAYGQKTPENLFQSPWSAVCLNLVLYEPISVWTMDLMGPSLPEPCILQVHLYLNYVS